MEDSGVIAQWTNNRSHSGGMNDLGVRGFTAHTSGSMSANNKSGTFVDSRQQRSRSSSAAKRGSNPNRQGGKGKKVEKLPPIASKHQGRNNASKGAATAASGGSLTSKKGQKATGSRSPTPKGSSGGKRKGSPSSASRMGSGASSFGKPLGSGRRGKSSRASSGFSRSRASSVTSTSRRRKSLKKKGGSRPGSRKRSTKGKKGKKRPASSRGAFKEDTGMAYMTSLLTAEAVQRVGIEEEEDTTRELFMPDYNLLVMNLVRAQLAVVNDRQQYLNDAFRALRAHGIQIGSGQDPNTAIEMLRLQVQAEMQKQVDEVRVENGTLRGLLEEKKTELEEKTTEMQGLRDKVNRKLMRFEVDCESLKAEVQSALQTSQLDVDRMKRDLGHRIDVATASLRTPKYDTALRSMQDMVRTVQEEIQEHHDTLTKLIVSIGAQDTFLREKSDSMHSNFPTRYRDELRKLDNDQLLNVLDVLSFHDAVVETVGKALYVLQKSEHSTNVF
ncbi:hypothetical protein MOQ_007130 [Trypanosoma cruzi marinkellei]|uniref:Uncharacterized protein n=1 Tax=Trypanosoma cruzi marinkellei TaxID=85056 RepID=K2N3E1_TRYCR|nr:hypothetical protein MOQ_007130 [Trypanosoma cruzi marinkellei]